MSDVPPIRVVTDNPADPNTIQSLLPAAKVEACHRQAPTLPHAAHGPAKNPNR
jgi:hypothetical protein